MIKREGLTDILEGYVKTVNDSIIEPLAKCLHKLSYQTELRDSKRFQEAEAKIKFCRSACERSRNNYYLRENVQQALRKTQEMRVASRMTNFLEDETGPENTEIKTALAPYLEVLTPTEDIRRLLMTLMNQGRIKKMALPYAEITASLTEVAAVAGNMPSALMNNVCGVSELLDKVA